MDYIKNLKYYAKNNAGIESRWLDDVQVIADLPRYIGYLQELPKQWEGSDWLTLKGTTVTEQPIDDYYNFVLWIVNNLHDKWGFTTNDYFIFKSKKDAILFKLRWQ